MAAYLYLPRASGDRSYRTECREPGMVIDFERDDRPIGIEITAPGRVSPAEVNRVLEDLGLPPLGTADLAPLAAA